MIHGKDKVSWNKKIPLFLLSRQLDVERRVKIEFFFNGDKKDGLETTQKMKFIGFSDFLLSYFIVIQLEL